MKKTTGVELVALSRVMTPTCFFLSNLYTKLNLLSLMKLGTSTAYTKGRTFVQRITDSSKVSHECYINAITNLDNNPQDKTPQGGDQFLFN